MSDKLQRYIDTTIDRIANLEAKSTALSNIEVVNVARASMEVMNPGQIDALLQIVYSLDFRKDVVRKLKPLLEAIKSDSINLEVTMGDKVDKSGDEYHIGERSQIGAVGPNPHVHHVNFAQAWSESKESLDLQSLARELDLLRTAMRSEATEPEQDLAVAAIATAEVEARKGNGTKVLENLAKAGQWALSMAQQIGVKVAVEAIGKALGIG